MVVKNPDTLARNPGPFAVPQYVAVRVVKGALDVLNLPGDLAGRAPLQEAAPCRGHEAVRLAPVDHVRA